MIEISLIRHGRTNGNEQKRYIGRTDEPLSESGLSELRAAVAARSYPPAQAVYASPMLRCVQTVRVIYPGVLPTLVPELREYDFGSFEGLTYEDLKDNPEYQNWIASEGRLGVPGGEDMAHFRARCALGFEGIVTDALSRGLSSAAVVAHGGTIMAVMSALSQASEHPYEYMLRNGEGYDLRLDEALWNDRKNVEQPFRVAAKKIPLPV